MTATLAQIQVYYEIAMSIGNSLDLGKMLRESLGAYLRELYCGAGIVFHFAKYSRENVPIEPVFSIPRTINQNPAFRAAMEEIPRSVSSIELTHLLASLPINGGNTETGFFHIMELPDFGLLVLLRVGANLDPSVIRSLKPLNEKLSRACTACLQNRVMTGLVERLKQEAAEREKAEKAQRDSDERFLTVLDSLDAHIYVAELDTYKILFVNKTMKDRFGYDLNGRTCWEVLRASTKPCDHCTNVNLLDEDGNPTGLCVWEDKDPITGRCYINCDRAIKWVDGRYVRLQIATDITNLKKLEEDRQRVADQRVEAITTLAGGIAHEFNNALTVVMGTLELLRMRLQLQGQLDNYFGPVASSIERMTRLTDQLLAYARGGKYRPQDIALSDFVETALPLVRHRMNPHIDLETELDKSLPNVEADHTQMQMVLSALLNNAAEAIQERGRIRISTTLELVTEEMVRGNPDAKPRSYVCLTVEDDGKGMDEETQNKVFVPFFTTKFQGRGLGMAAVHGIIQNHGGWISMSSRLGEGTTVRVYLPAQDEPHRQLDRDDKLRAGHKGTVLLIEDEEIVMEVSRSLLDALGYRVLEARTAKEAVEISENIRSDIDIAMLDFKLPDMEAEQLYPLLKKLRPRMKVIVCSGYSVEGPVQRILDAGADAFLQKPFSLADLTAKFAEIKQPRGAREPDGP